MFYSNYCSSWSPPPMEQFCLNTHSHRPESRTGGVFFKLTSQFSEPLHTAPTIVWAAFGNPKGAMDWKTLSLVLLMVSAHLSSTKSQPEHFIYLPPLKQVLLLLLLLSEEGEGSSHHHQSLHCTGYRHIHWTWKSYEVSLWPGKGKKILMHTHIMHG